MAMVGELFDVMGKFVLAVLLAGALGLDRQLKGRAAGLRTHILVCLGSTLMMIVSDQFARHWGEGGAPVWLDRGRIAAGIITGIGFLGAGTIMTVEGEQRGLTTAAMVWFVAALGITIGGGYPMIAICATVFALFTVRGLERVERLLPAHEHFSLTIRLPHGLERLEAIEEVIRSKGFDVTASRIKLTGEDADADMLFSLRGTDGVHIEELASVLRKQFSDAQKITFEK